MSGRITAILVVLSLGLSAAMSRATSPPERSLSTAGDVESPVSEAGLTDGEAGIAGPGGGECPLADASCPAEPPSEPPGESWTPVIQQGVQDFSAGSARVVFNARYLHRLPGLLELPGRHNHRLSGWIEWLMALARLESTNMSVVAPPLQPHAPPVQF